MKKLFIFIVAVIFVFSVYGPSTEHAEKGGQPAVEARYMAKEQAMDKTEMKEKVKKHEGEKDGQIKGKKKERSKDPRL